MARWLRACATFVEAQSSVPSTLRWVQVQGIQDWLLNSTGTHTHLYIPSHLHINIKKRNKKKIDFGAKHCSSCVKPKRQQQDDYTEIETSLD